MAENARLDNGPQESHVERAYEELRQHASGLVQAWARLEGGNWTAAHGRGLQLAAKQLVRACERLRLSLSRKAGELETFIRVFVDTAMTPSAEQLRTLAALVSTLASTAMALDMVRAQQALPARAGVDAAPANDGGGESALAVAATRRVEPMSVPKPLVGRKPNKQLVMLVGEPGIFGELAASFSEHGYLVQSHVRGEAAVEALSHAVPRAILVGAAGANVIPQLKQAAAADATRGEDHLNPVLGLVAARQDVGRRLMAMRQGVRYFEPPLDPLAILVAVTGDAVMPGSAGRVLLVDRDRQRGLEAAAWLKEAGHTVRFCQAAAEALEALASFQPQLAVVDADLPGADSMRLVHGLRDDPQAREIPVILVASSRELAMREQAIAGGADEYLLRPVKPRHLVGVVEARLKRSRRFVPRRAAQRDEATGLYPRREFIERAEAARGQSGAMVLYAVLDEHEMLRKQLGISGQSRLDIAVGEAVRESLRGEDLASLYQDCRYLVLLRRADRTDAMAAAESLRESLARRRLAVGNLEISLRASLGLASLEGESADVAVRNAEAAALAGMHLGGNRSMCFEPSRASLVPAERDAQLRGAMQSRRFGQYMEVRGAPWLPLRGRIPGQYELQFQWRPGGPGQPAISQAEAAVVARDCACGLDFDRFLVAEAMQLRAEQLQRGRQLRLVVDLSPLVVEDGGFPSWIENLLRERRLSGSGLAITLPAGVLAERAESLISLCQRMRPLAIRIGLRDIGRDMTLVHRLRGVPIDFLRLSPELSVGASANDRASEMMAALARRAHQAGAAVIACAVENREQLRQLSVLGIDYAESPIVAAASNSFDFDFARFSLEAR